MQAAENAFLLDLPMVLSASRLAQPVNETPGAVTIIDREMIRASGARSVAELLRGVPGFQIGYRSGYLPLTTYHGLSDESPRRLLVRIDGRSAYSPYLVSGTEWHTITIDLEDIERIEIFRGSNAATYGSQAFMGVVNIVTRAAVDSPRFRARVHHGNNGIRDQIASLGVRGEGRALRMSLGREADAGLAGVNDRYRRERADLRADVQLSPAHRIELHAGQVRLRAATGDSENVADPPRHVRNATGFGQIRWRWQPDPRQELSVTVYQQSETTRDGFVVGPRSGLPLAGMPLPDGSFIPPDWRVNVDFGSRIMRNDFELEHAFSPADPLRVVWGLGYRDDRIHARQVFNRDRVTYRSARLFGNLELRASPTWLFNSGIMLERGNYSGLLVAPRVAANYHVSEGHTLRASIGRGYRRPTPFERHADMRFNEVSTGWLVTQAYQPSPEIRPERIKVAELGYRGEMRRLNSSVDVRIFEERIDRMTRSSVVPSELSPPQPWPQIEARRFFSDDRARVRGLELEMMWRPSATSWAGFNYTRIHVSSSNDRAERSAPRHAASVFAAWQPLTDWTLSVAHHYVGAMGWYIRESQSVDAYRRTDLRLAHHVEYGHKRMELALVARNLGKRHADYRPALTTPRHVYVVLGVEF